MKLYYYDQRKVTPFVKPVLIWNAHGDVQYTLEREKTLKPGYRLILCDANGEQIAAIRQKLAALHTTFLVQIYGKELTVCLRRSMQGMPYCEISEFGWTAGGRFSMQREYEIRAGEQLIACVHEPLSSGSQPPDGLTFLANAMRPRKPQFIKDDCCEIEFSDALAADELVAAVMAIEAAGVAAC